MPFQKGHSSGNRRKEITWEVDDNGCWNCTSHAPNGDGYPGIKRNGKNMKIHRYMYEKYKGEISDGLHSLHKCDNRMCINPEHLFLGTNADNVADKMAKGRCKPGKGEHHWKSKLTEKDVIKIKTELNHLNRNEIAEMYGVQPSAISKIRAGRTWNKIGA